MVLFNFIHIYHVPESLSKGAPFIPPWSPWSQKAFISWLIRLSNWDGWIDVLCQNSFRMLRNSNFLMILNCFLIVFSLPYLSSIFYSFLIVILGLKINIFKIHLIGIYVNDLIVHDFTITLYCSISSLPTTCLKGSWMVSPFSNLLLRNSTPRLLLKKSLSSHWEGSHIRQVYFLLPSSLLNVSRFSSHL